MNPATLNPKFYQGDSWDLTISVTQYTPPSGAASAFDLSNYTAKSQLRRRPDSPWVTLEFDCTITDPSGGIMVISAVPSATAAIPAGTYSWDVEISGTSGSESGSVKTLLRGYTSVLAEITR